MHTVRKVGLGVLIIVALYALLNARPMYLHGVLTSLPDTIVVANYTCDNGYTINIEEHPEFDKGNKFELGHFSRITYPKKLRMISDQKVEVPWTRGEKDFYSSNIQASESFATNELGSYIIFPSSVSVQDFKTLAPCISENKTAIESQMREIRISHSLEGTGAPLKYFPPINGALLLSKN